MITDDPLTRIVECIVVDHDLSLVAVAALICLATCHTAFRIHERARRKTNTSNNVWVPAGALCLGGGIWSTHFVAMMSFKSSLPIAFELGPTIASAIMAITFCGLGLWLSSQGRHLIGGAVVGFAVGIMHYTGMAGLSGPIQILWDAGLLTVSWATGIAFATAALYVHARFRNRRGHIGSVTLLVLAICSLHFIGMSSMDVGLNPFVEPTVAMLIERQGLAVALVGITALILGGGLMLAHLDSFVEQRNRREEARLNTYVAELERAQRTLQKRTVELQESLLEADQLSKAKSDFLATMSHELRTPLNAIIGFSDFILMEPKGPLGDPGYRRDLQDINASGRHLLQMINEVLDFSKIAAGRMTLDEERFRLEDVIMAALRMVETQAENAGIILSNEVPEQMPELLGDRKKVVQILLNLLSNAVKFSDDGGQVSIGATNGPGGVVITVRDNGIGMTDAQIKQAVEAFRQVDSSLARRHEGTGLGLPLCIKLVELHDGKLIIESAPDKGTEVRVWFPTERVFGNSATAGQDAPAVAPMSDRQQAGRRLQAQ